MRVVAVTHGPSVGPGVFAEAVRGEGHELVEWSALGGGDPPAADALLVFGGAMHPDEDERHPWLAGEFRLLADALDRGTPLLGVCLGAQLIARAAGAAVGRAQEPEVGWLPVDLLPAAQGDPVLGGLPERFDALQWHHYTWELPPDAVELATSGVCTQAFRLGSAWGIQFHAEVTEAQVAAWLVEDAGDVADPAGLRAETRSRIGEWNRLGRELARRFVWAASS
jgi:GMP synthase-like glutamine amidotransferase